MLETTRRYAFPEYPLDGMTVLDVGCNTGWAFEYPHFAKAQALYGIDVDRSAIAEGLKKYPHLHLQVAPAEKLPFPDRTFDCVISRVALPYTNIPIALREAHRVLKPEGRLYLTMHDWHHQKLFFREALKSFSVKRVIDLIYVSLVSVLFTLTGHCLPRFWSGRFETIQTPGRMQKLLRDCGFTQIRHERTDRQNIFEATRPQDKSTTVY